MLNTPVENNKQAKKLSRNDLRHAI